MVVAVEAVLPAEEDEEEEKAVEASRDDNGSTEKHCHEGYDKNSKQMISPLPMWLRICTANRTCCGQTSQNKTDGQKYFPVEVSQILSFRSSQSFRLLSKASLVF